MKKLLLSSLVLLALSCNQGTDADKDMSSDSVDMIEPNALRNDVPMRTVDTSKNLMMDTADRRDTMLR